MKVDYKRFLVVLAVMLLPDGLLNNSPAFLRGDSLAGVFAGDKLPATFVPSAVAIALPKKSQKKNSLDS